MCGIFGLISNKSNLEVGKLIREGLERLEYRGYDSAGIALVNKGNIELRKKSGRIAEINKNGWFRFNARAIWSGAYPMGNTW